MVGGENILSAENRSQPYACCSQGGTDWPAHTVIKKETALLSDVQTTLVRKEKLARAQQPNLQEHTIPAAESGTVH